MSAKRIHQPSGILIVWLGLDGKPHTKSIPVGFNRQITEIDARTELALLQLESMGSEYGINRIKSAPMITTGLTRQDAKQALLKEPNMSNKLLLTQ